MQRAAGTFRMVPDPQTSKGGAAIVLRKNAISPASPFVIPKKIVRYWEERTEERRGILKGALLARSAP